MCVLCKRVDEVNKAHREESSLNLSIARSMSKSDPAVHCYVLVKNLFQLFCSRPSRVNYVTMSLLLFNN